MYDVTKARIEELFSRYGGLRIAVVGDLFLDRWYEIDESLNEPSLETGLTAYQVTRKRAAPGAAGTVLNNLSEMGVGRLSVISALGDDGDGWELRELLKARRVDVSDVVVSGRIVTPSYVKPLHPEERNRLDIKNFAETPEEIRRELLARIRRAFAENDALILLDQVCEADRGVLTADVREGVCALAKSEPGRLVFADSRAFIDRFHDVVIKCNNFEAARMTGHPVREEDPFSKEAVFASMDALSRLTGREAIVTCSRHGVAVPAADGPALVPAVPQPGPIDICGAGDACSAGLVPALCAGATLAEAAVVGNLSSGVTVRQLGRTGTASREAMLALYDECAAK